MSTWAAGSAAKRATSWCPSRLQPAEVPDRDQALAKVRDLTMLTDILPTGFHGAVRAEVGVGSTVYIAGAGPVGLAAAASAHILGAAVVMIGDMNPDRLAHAEKVGFVAVDLTAHDRLGELIEAVVLNQAMDVTRPAGLIGIPGLYVTSDPGATDEAAKKGALSLSLGTGWSKAHSFHTGQTPTARYNRRLMQAILHDRLPIADIVNAVVIPLEDAPKGYAEFDEGAATKFVLDPHGMIAKAA